LKPSNATVPLVASPAATAASSPVDAESAADPVDIRLAAADKIASAQGYYKHHQYQTQAGNNV